MNSSFNFNSISSLKTFCLSMRLPSFSLYYLLHQGIFRLSYSHKLPQCFISVFHPLPDLSQLYSSGSYSSESLKETAVGCSTLVKTPFLSSIRGFSRTICPDKKQLLQSSGHPYCCTVSLCWCQVDWLAKHTLGWLIHQSTTIIFTNSNLISKVPKCMRAAWRLIWSLLLCQFWL